MSSNIVITGAGLVSPLGLNLNDSWQAVKAGQCGIGPMSAMEQSPEREGGQAPDLPDDFLPDRPREVRYLRWALNESLESSGIAQLPKRWGVVLGTTLHGMRAAGKFLRNDDVSELQHFISGAVAGAMVEELPPPVIATTTCSACSSALSAIAMASTLLETGYADVMIAGGYDAICEYVYAGFNSLRLVASGPVRPFSKDRQGMKVAEGYALLVLERQGERAAKPIAQIAGYGESSDVHHLTQPHPKGDGAARAIRAALDDAQLQTTDIDFISAHATSTPDNDRGEFAAFNQTFQEHLPNISVAGFKANVGHTLGAAGACELLFASSALNEQLVPPTPNVEADRVEFDALQINTGDSAIEQPITHTLNTSLGFGGSNSCMILSRPRTGNGQRSELQEVVITGIGLISALGETTDAFLDRAFDDSAAPITEDTDPIDPSKYIGLINARRARRLSDYVKLTLAATTLAYRSAGIEDIAAFGETCHGMLGTAHGSTGYCQQYYRQIVDEGVDAGNPLLFAEGVPNSAAAHLSMTMSIKGLCQTVIGMRTAGIDAVALAAQRIASGRWQRAVVGAAEEFSPVANNAYRQCGSLRGNAFASGSAALILESQSSANSAGRSALGRIVSSQSRANLTNDATALEDMWNELNKPTHVVSAANDGHIEDVFVRPGCSHHSIYGHQPESFSVSPLIALATVLRRGRMPDDKATMDDFAVVSSDPIGAVSALRVQRVT